MQDVDERVLSKSLVANTEKTIQALGGDGYVKCFSHDAALMQFVGVRSVPGDPLFGVPDR